MKPSDVHYLELALDAIRRAHPTAVKVSFETSDQNYYGFLLDTVTDADGTEIELTDGLYGEVAEYVEDLEWNGVMGEDRHGYATLKLTAPDTTNAGMATAGNNLKVHRVAWQTPTTTHTECGLDIPRQPQATQEPLAKCQRCF